MKIYKHSKVFYLNNIPYKNILYLQVWANEIFIRFHFYVQQNLIVQTKPSAFCNSHSWYKRKFKTLNR